MTNAAKDTFKNLPGQAHVFETTDRRFRVFCPRHSKTSDKNYFRPRIFSFRPAAEACGQKHNEAFHG